ncbi:hypothetical protein GCM10007989_12710 [Devosia pacifica]|uniref:(2Fe-2S) ferredoxin n=1 Tax=Devosia pacifica TaxID=1335967 RepID=A0A918VRW4_9HYPH|nr:(2Fe-2S) ferredoxin domain-containing protein [Devosia pacifica]GHA18831.1 hypothetical protein GCM10007989_12710 [Devosia pacifica]
MSAPDAAIFCISQQHLSASREASISASVRQACTLPCFVVRLEGTGQTLQNALDACLVAGHARVLVQPIGLPFSQSLAAWLPGVLAHWKQSSGARMDLLLGSETIAEGLVGALATQAVANVSDATPIDAQKPSLGKRGWDAPPPFRHHLLVCTGPRCHYRGAPDLKLALNEALVAEGVKDACLMATTGCLYPCNKGPMVALYPRGEWYRLEDDVAVKRFVRTVIRDGKQAPDLLIHRLETFNEDHHTGENN